MTDEIPKQGDRSEFLQVVDHLSESGALPRNGIASSGMEDIAIELLPSVDWASFIAGDESPPRDQGVDTSSAVLIPQWDLRKTDESGYLALEELAEAIDEIWMVVPAGLLTLRHPRNPLRAFRESHRPSLVIEGRLGIGGVHPTFVSALVALQRSAGAKPVTRFFRVPSTGGAHASAIISDISSLLNRGGGTTKWGFVHRGDLSTSTWRAADYDPALERMQQDLASLGETRQLKDVFQIFVARPGLTRPTPGLVETAQPVLHARDIVAGTLIPDVTSAPPRHWAVELLGGDILLPRSERVGVPTRPLLVSRPDLPLAAGMSVTVLRPRRPLDPAQTYFYLAYLASSQSRHLLRPPDRGGMVLDMSSIGTMPVPVPDAPLLDAIEALSRARDAFETWAGQASDLLSTIFDTEHSLAAVRTALVNQGRDMRQRRAAGELVTTLNYRIREFYPYPVAYRWRQVQTRLQERSWGEAYAAGLDCAEILLAYAALLALSGAEQAGVRLGSSKTLVAKFSDGNQKGGGSSLGDWVNVLKELSTNSTVAQLESDSLLGALGGLLPQQGDVAGAQVRISERRNDEAHLRRVDPSRIEEATADLVRDLEILLRGASALTDLALVHVLDNKWDSLGRHGVATLQVLRGDHPIAQTERRTHSLPEIEEDSLYVIDGQGSWTLLRPLLTRSRCPECGSWSIYHPDKRVHGKLQLRALDHGHTTDGDSVEGALATLGWVHTDGNA